MSHFRHVWLAAIAGLLIPVFACISPAFGQSDTYKPGGGGGGQKSGPGQKSSGQDKRGKLKEEGRGLFGGGDAQRTAASEKSWSIVLAAFREEDHAAAAQQALTRVRTQGGLQEAYLDVRGSATVIAFGHYPTMEAGQQDLERIRGVEVEVNGERQKPFASSFLAPPADIRGTMPAYDLRNIRKERPWALYTLQVGVYSREDKEPTSKELAEFRTAAEQAAVQLRREGEEAYYYHGPKRSMVTIGTFGREDFDPQISFEAPTLKQLRKRFPYNLYNGQGIRRTLTVTDPQTGRAVKKEKLESSGLVMVPKD